MCAGGGSFSIKTEKADNCLKWQDHMIRIVMMKSESLIDIDNLLEWTNYACSKMFKEIFIRKY